MSLPGKDPIANALRRVLPARTAYRITRRMNIARQERMCAVRNGDMFAAIRSGKAPHARRPAA